MNVRYHVDGHLSAGVREVVEREVRFLDTRLATFADDLKSLDVTVHHQPRDGTYTSNAREIAQRLMANAGFAAD